VHYGHKLNLATGRSGLIFDVVIEAGNPADAERFIPMLERHIAANGTPPRQTTSDGGYASLDNLNQAKAMGVRDVAFHKKRGLSLESMVKSRWVYRKLRNFRAGIEANISCLKRAFGLARCTWPDGLTSRPMSGHPSSLTTSHSSQGSPRPEPRHLSRHSPRRLGHPTACHAMLAKRVFLATPYPRMHAPPDIGLTQALSNTSTSLRKYTKIAIYGRTLAMMMVLLIWLACLAITVELLKRAPCEPFPGAWG